MARAELLDTITEGEEDNKSEELVESLEQEQEETPEEPAEETQEELPDKYRNKSFKEVVEMHQNAEQALGKQSSEVGELRKIVDDFISASQLSNDAPVEQEDIDFFTNPQEAVDHRIANHPEFKEMRRSAQQQKMLSAKERLQLKHPDINQIIQDEAFARWVGSSEIRKDLLVRADEHYDFDAADELFTHWKERQGIVNQTKSVEKNHRKAKVKAASTGNTQSASPASRKKIYRRSDIVKMMRDDPERYEALSSEIIKAYREKRVRDT